MRIHTLRDLPAVMFRPKCLIPTSMEAGLKMYIQDNLDELPMDAGSCFEKKWGWFYRYFELNRRRKRKKRHILCF